MTQEKLPLINTSHGSETRNIINKLIKLFNSMGYTYNEALKKAHEILDESQKKSNNVLNEAERVNAENISTQQQINAVMADIKNEGVSVPELVQSRFDAEGNEFPVLKERLDTKETDTAERLSRKVESTRLGGLHPAKLTNVKHKEITGQSNEPRVLDVFNGYVWADNNAGKILKRPVDGGEWVVHSDRPAGQALRLLPTDDDEVLLLNSYQLYKSTNFFDGSVSWTQKQSANSNTFFLQWGLDGYRNKFILTSYSGARSASRYAWISLDAGDTWEVAYDSVEQHGAELANSSHMHAVCYDRWSDRFYLSDGHGPEIAGVYISADDGNTWITNDKLKQNPSPTTMTATPHGIVCGSDHYDNGLYGIVRQDDPEDEEIRMTWKWQTGRTGLMGFAQRGFYDEYSGLVYVSYRTDYDDTNPVIAAGTPTSGGLVYEWDSGATAHDRIINVVVPNEKEILFYGTNGGNQGEHAFTATIHPPGAPTLEDEGNLIHGKAKEGNSLALGYNAQSEGLRSVVIGVNARAGYENTLALGYNAHADNTQSVALGSNAHAKAISVALGEKASTENGAIAIGSGSRALSNGIAMGQDVFAHTEAIVIGMNAQSVSYSSRGVAIGAHTLVHSSSVALGSNTETSGQNQASIGQRHLEMLPLISSTTGTVSGERARLFSRKNSDGKIQMCVQFPGANTTANTIVLATQP